LLYIVLSIVNIAVSVECRHLLLLQHGHGRTNQRGIGCDHLYFSSSKPTGSTVGPIKQRTAIYPACVDRIGHAAGSHQLHSVYQRSRRRHLDLFSTLTCADLNRGVSNCSSLGWPAGWPHLYLGGGQQFQVT